MSTKSPEPRRGDQIRHVGGVKHLKQGSQVSQAPETEGEHRTTSTYDRTTARQPITKAHAKGEIVDLEDSENEQQRSDSFYWQSPHSSCHSMDGERTDQSVAAPPIEHFSSDHGQEQEKAPQEQKDIMSSTLLSHSTLGSYGASALGFGGPSDWEHFGDYEAEDIDDTELYIRPRSPDKASRLPDTAELPVEPGRNVMPTTDVQQTTEQNTLSELPRPYDGSAVQHASEQDSGEVVSQALPGEGAQQSAALAEGVEPETVQAENTIESSDVPLNDFKIIDPIPDARDNDALNTNLDETIKVWSRADSTEHLVDAGSIEHTHAKRDEPTSNHIVEPTATDIIQPEALKTPLVTAAPPAQITLTHSEPEEQPQSEKVVPVPPKKIQDCFAVDSGQQQVFLAGPTSSLTSTANVHSDPAAITSAVPDRTSHGASANQPTFAPTQGPSKTQETGDPYAGLDAWGKASLNRYIAMLREESQAETDKEKFNIFTVFTTRETRLRAVLYDAEKEQTNLPDTLGKVNTSVNPIKRASTTSYKRASKALPALPEGASNQDPIEDKGHSKKLSKKLSAAAIIGNSKPVLKAIETTNTSSVDDASVMVDSPNSVQYSPGGRPLVSRAPKAIRLSKQADDSQQVIPDGGKDSSDVNGLSNLPIPTSPDHPASENTAAYVPFKYSGGRSEAQNYAASRLSKRQSVLRPYSKMMGSDESREVSSVEVVQLEDAPKVAPLNGLSRALSGSAKEKVELDLRRFVHADFDPLVSVLPEAGEIRSDSSKLSDLKSAMDSVPDDFVFIHQSVVAWDTKARRQRDSNERERHARQVESEQRIDALFDDHEIGYGDISELESGFKRSEAARKADEDRAEYQTFVAEVFDIVWTRLHYEIDQLAPHYQKYIDVLNSTTAGKDMFDPSSDHFALAPTMDSLLTLHQKLEIRHQKAFEAVLERDRRLKKVELSPWYSLGNVAKVKQLERQFDVAEKKAILDYCRQRDIRANSLMDSLDQNTLRGVGANQDYMEMVMKAVRRIASGRAFASQPGCSEPGVGLNEVTRAKSITKALATSSEQIVQTFHVADMLLNAADYELSVAKARLEGADTATFQNLKEERAKEDQKLMRDLEHRLALIREDSRRTHDEIVKLLLFLGVQSGHAGASSDTSQPVDRGHEERIQKALEEAKRRNAATGPAAAPVI